jgi:hypothetical protein
MADAGSRSSAGSWINIVKYSKSAHSMNMFYKRLWGEMQKYFIAPRQKKLNSIKQLIVHSIVLAVKCIGADGDIRNESGRGRLWKGTDEDRLFFHHVFLNKWERHMERLGYPFSQDVTPKLGSPKGMCVPKESAIAILMEAWEAQGRYFFNRAKSVCTYDSPVLKLRRFLHSSHLLHILRY